MAIQAETTSTCFWCKKQYKKSKTYVMEYKTPYDHPSVWKKLWTTESHSLECAKEELGDRLNEACNTADSPDSYAEWNNSEYRVRLVKEE